MAIPIKERGIRWAESYSGEKSVHLKEEMDSQIGPGAYYRWEGHDPTTGNDYYVVVSPGFGKKRGYHFFAGLRKMPADHGASGKKFSTQREAMSHARETWQVPPPLDKPPKPEGYKIADIQNAPILIEIQHKSHASSGMTMEKLASLVGSASEQPHSQRRIGSRITADILCYAYGAAPVIGFLPAMFSRPRFTVVDVVNVPNNHRVWNEFTGQMEDVSKDKETMAPVVATYEPPKAEEFQEAVYAKGFDVQHELVTVTGSSIARAEAFGKPGAGSRFLRWDMLRMSPTISISRKDLANKALWNGLWERLASKHGTKRSTGLYCNLTAAQQRKQEIKDFEYPRQKEDAGLTMDRKQIVPNMRADIYDEVIREVLATFPRANISVKDSTQRRLQYVREAEQDKFKWDEAFGEVINVTGSSLLRYDDAGLPLCVVPQDRALTKMEQDTSRKQREYIVKDPAAMVLPYASTELQQLGMLLEYMTLLNSKPEDPNALRTWETGIPEMLESLEMPQEASLLTLLNGPQDTPEWNEQVVSQSKALGVHRPPMSINEVKDGLFARVRNELASMMENHANSIVALQQSGELYESEHGQMMKDGIDGIVAARKAGDGHKMREAQNPIKYHLAGFKWLAAQGRIPLSNEQFVHSYTVPPELIDYEPKDVFHMDEMGISPWATMESPTEKDLRLVSKPYALPYTVNFPSRHAGDQGHVRVGRWYDANKQRWTFGALPTSVRPEQGADTGLRGLPAVVRNTSMMLASPAGKPLEIPQGEGRRYKTSMGPEGPEAIVEGHYDVLAAPEYASAKKSDKSMIQKSIGRYGWVLMYVPTVAYEACVKGDRGRPLGSSLREYPERNVIGADPKTSPSKYDVTDEAGEEVNLADKERAFKVPGSQNVYFKDNLSAFLMLAKVMGRNPQELGPLAVIDNTDQRIIDSTIKEGVYYANCVDEYDKQRSTNEAQFFDPAGNLKPVAPDAGHDIAELYKMVEDGMKFRANFDEKYYEYGITCRSCNKDREKGAVMSLPIRKAYNEAVRQALEDPESVFERKVRELFGIAYLDDGNENMVKDADGIVVFGSVMDAEEHIEAFRAALSEEVGKDIQEIYVKPLGEHVMPFILNEHPEVSHVVNQEAFVEHVQKTWGPEGRGLEPQEVPSEWSEEQKGLTRPPGTPLPGTGEPITTLPPSAFAPPQAAEPEAAGPEEVLEPEPQPQPRPKPKPSPQPSDPIKSSVIEKLIALADKLDSSGRHGEADAVDRVLRATCRSK